MNGLRGRRVLVTGAASGIGAATAIRLAAEGCSIGAVDRDAGALIQPVTTLRTAGRLIVAEVADVSAWSAVERAVNGVAAQLAGLDAVVNVAGIGGYTGDVARTSLDDWRAVIDIDLTGVFLVSRAALPHLRQSGGGSYVHVSSQYGLVGGAGFPAYCAAKAGVIGLTRAMAVDHAQERIRVNCVCPGPIETPMLARSRANPGRDQERERTKQRVLLGHSGAPTDVAALIAFLLSDEAANITGSVITTDGGWTAA